ncbi:viral capsid associated protein 1054 [Neodiprion abietis nucleopolyhedrovirus]|uniref:Viral capsid associated protein 1054 n=1 Tax=Neodiprion abietis nucleopolyhedrovirus TaxID=204507 RepID=Q0ZNZ2_9CBAC|nr:viral capsid associated protein 1054 [Neodiprion abietis nucleopolyhedrovirus]ABC74962.1 viral capsid associated protein 1054 [Neodiprion abietis nucleopolyhedrovirus]
MNKIYKPTLGIPLPKCTIHPQRKDCALRKKKNQRSYVHLTKIENTNLYDSKNELFMRYLVPQIEIIRYVKNDNVILLAYTKAISLDRYKGIDLAGECNINVLSNVKDQLSDIASELLKHDVIVIQKKRYFFDLLYNTNGSIIILPQDILAYEPVSKIDEMYVINGYSNSNDIHTNISIYYSLLIINTIMTMCLNEKNPLSDAGKSYAKIVRIVKPCPFNKNNLGMCTRNFANHEFKNNHLFDMPLKLLKQFLVFQKIVLTPNRPDSYLYRFTVDKVKNNIQYNTLAEQLNVHVSYIENIFHYFDNIQTVQINQ